MFYGLSAFPLTPLHEDKIDLSSYAKLIERLADANVDSITALGGTGSYAYLDVDERRAVASVAMKHAEDTPVIVGVGSFRKSTTVNLARHAADSGAAGVLVGPVSYQSLTEREVLGLYEDLSASVDIPIVIYDNPGGTPFRFTDLLLREVSQLPNIVSIKTSGLPRGPVPAALRVEELRGVISGSMTIGVSGDSTAAEGLLAGGDVWYSVVGGLFPRVALDITQAANLGDTARARKSSGELEALWDLFDRFGSYRVVAALAEHLGYAVGDSLPRPVRGLEPAARLEAVAVARDLNLS